jgi:hypothetical protein
MTGSMSRQAIPALMLATALLLSPDTGRAENATAALAPCNDVARYLREFAVANPDLATSAEMFPFRTLSDAPKDAAAGYVESTVMYDGLVAAQTAILPLEIASAVEPILNESSMWATYLDHGWAFMDGRSFGDRLVLYTVDPQSDCTEAAILDTAGDSPKLAYRDLIDEEYLRGNETCDNHRASFNLIRIGRSSFPSITEIGRQDTQYRTRIDVLPRSENADGKAQAQCLVSSSFTNFEDVTEWTMPTEERKKSLAILIRGALESLERDFRAGSTTIPHIEAEAVNQLTPIHITANDARAPETLAARLRGSNLVAGGPVLLEIDRQKVVLIYGEEVHGWDYAGHQSVIAWLWDGAEGKELLRGDYLILASKPEIIVSAP